MFTEYCAVLSYGNCFGCWGYSALSPEDAISHAKAKATEKTNHTATYKITSEVPFADYTSKPINEDHADYSVDMMGGIVGKNCFNIELL